MATILSIHSQKNWENESIKKTKGFLGLRIKYYFEWLQLKNNLENSNNAKSL